MILPPGFLKQELITAGLLKSVILSQALLVTSLPNALQQTQPWCMTVWMNQLVFPYSFNPMYKLQRSAQLSSSNQASNEVLQKQVWILRKSGNQQVLWYPTSSKCQRIGQDTTNPVHSGNYGQYRSEWTEANIKNSVFADASIRQVYKAWLRKECLHKKKCG